MRLFCCKEEIMLNKNISFIECIKRIHIKKNPPILLYQPINGAGYEWQIDANW